MSPGATGFGRGGRQEAELIGPGGLGVEGVAVLGFWGGVGLAVTQELPNADGEAACDYDAEGPFERSGPLLKLSGPEADRAAPIDDCEPGDERIAQDARQAKDGEEAVARNAQRAGREDKWGERNGRRKDGGEKDRENWMLLNPCDDAIKQTRRNPALEGGFATFLAELPGRVSADEAAGDGGHGKQPGISFVRDHPEKQQIGGAGDGQRNDGGIDDRNQEEAQRPKVHNPVRHKGMMRAMGGGFGGGWGENAHCKLDARIERQAARRGGMNLEGKIPARRDFRRGAVFASGR